MTSLNRIVIYAKNVDRIITFYEKHFGFKSQVEEGDRITELVPSHGGASLMIHPAGKGIREGQASVKLVFDIENVEAFKAACFHDGLKFGVIHKANGYVFANAKDPSKNSIQISSRAFRKSSEPTMQQI